MIDWALASIAVAQPVLVSPLPHAIVQVKPPKEAGLLHIIVAPGNKAGDRVLAMDYLITSDDKDQPIFTPNWSALYARGGTLDTTLVLPFIAKAFRLHYRIVTPDSIYTGVSHHLRIGHVFAIAGQSNAQGWSPPPYPQPQGEVWVLRNPRSWEYGGVPSGRKWNSPWVYMANRFRRLVNDSLPIGIVNMAKGGTSLIAYSPNGSWKRNDAVPEDVTTVYGHALRMFRGAGANFEAFFWIQGEADVVGVILSEEYRDAFQLLVENFEKDLGHSPAFYHLQISGQKQNDGGPDHLSWARIREAHRELYNSTLVGSAIAYPLSFDGIHYATLSTEAVGDRFAAAHAYKQYGQESPMFPPMQVDTALLVYEDPNEPELGMKVLLRARQGDQDARLLPRKQLHGFELKQGTKRYDTTRVVANVHHKLQGWIEVRIRNMVIEDTSGWSISYGLRGDPGSANAMDTCSASVLPNALIAFMDIPVVVGQEPKVPVASVRNRPKRPSDCRFTIYDLAGRIVEEEVRTTPEEWRLTPGLYLYRQDCREGSWSGKWLVSPR